MYNFSLIWGGLSILALIRLSAIKGFGQDLAEKMLPMKEKSLAVWRLMFIIFFVLLPVVFVIDFIAFINSFKGKTNDND